MMNWTFFTRCFCLTMVMVQSTLLVGRATLLCPEIKLQVDRLPDLHIPRAGHAVVCANGEITVIGGHTSGFVPTATAEYFRDGKWHLLNTVYAHDQGFFLPMESGNIIVSGGHEQPLGIGQTFTMERYDPVAHVFTGFGCLEKRRAMAEAVELDSGKVIISGNWYYDDCMECYDGSRQCQYVKEVSKARSYPYVFRVAKDDAFVFGAYDLHGVPIDSIIVDRLKGTPFRVPLFDTWRPTHIQWPFYSEVCFIGDKTKNDYSYLFPVTDSLGQWAVAQVRGTQFSILPTKCPVPMESSWGSVYYHHVILADRQNGRAYLFGTDKDYSRLYVLCIDYAHVKESEAAPLSLYYTDPLPNVGFAMPVLTDEGDLIIIGGTRDNNYEPLATALLLHLGNHAAAPRQVMTLWMWLLVAALILCGGGLAIVYLRQRNRNTITKNAEIAGSIDTAPIDDALMKRICQLMEEEHLFLNNELKVADVAAKLGTNSTYISATINSLKGCAFSQFVNGYRVEFAKQLLSYNPNKKISEVWASSGFANETSFFRTFKTFTGMTPSEWRAKSTDNS
jgi:AraC-like DNA-binding protein